MNRGGGRREVGEKGGWFGDRGRPRGRKKGEKRTEIRSKRIFRRAGVGASLLSMRVKKSKGVFRK